MMPVGNWRYAIGNRLRGQRLKAWGLDPCSLGLFALIPTDINK